jgi:hypothetical protein
MAASYAPPVERLRELHELIGNQSDPWGFDRGRLFRMAARELAQNITHGMQLERMISADAYESAAMRMIPTTFYLAGVRRESAMGPCFAVLHGPASYISSGSRPDEALAILEACVLAKMEDRR